MRVSAALQSPPRRAPFLGFRPRDDPEKSNRWMLRSPLGFYADIRMDRDRSSDLRDMPGATRHVELLKVWVHLTRSIGSDSVSAEGGALLRSSVALSSTATLRDLRTPVNKKFLQRNRRPNRDLPSEVIIRIRSDAGGIPSREPLNFEGERKPTHAFAPHMRRKDYDAIGHREFGWAGAP